MKSARASSVTNRSSWMPRRIGRRIRPWGISSKKLFRSMEAHLRRSRKPVTVSRFLEAKLM